jgi:predicted AAA+ superfamily ATPase
LEDERQIEKSPFHDALFESFVASEIIKAQINAGRRKDLYFFRDRAGLEVDFLVPKTGGRLLLLEAKATRTVRPSAAEALGVLTKAATGHSIEAVLVHIPPAKGPAYSGVRPGIRAVSFRAIPDLVLK